MSSPTASTRTLVIALLANLGIAVAKFVAAAITLSSAMLTEGVHSVVDSTNQLLLMWGRRQAKKPPDQWHPFGYGRELYFWSFVVAVLVFALGAGVSIYEGIIHILQPEEAVSPLIGYAVLLVAFVLEGWSTLEAFREFKAAKAIPAGSKPSSGRRTHRLSSSSLKMARRWPESSLPRSACSSPSLPGTPFTTAPRRS